ncbi:MAG: hypothetical protein BWY57_01709 [Betaproteobacteria bacterium ADurb.Bin341]|nr:MAG: hypothetical protein BWY57_01709 [Betaproteobacteria bacterium ADurb.Bin341]
MRQCFFRLAVWLAGCVGLKPSHLFPSPSKFFLLRKLVACLKRSAGMGIGVDVACADFKYRDLFKTQRYVGIDLDRDNLEKGLRLHARQGDVGILLNLLELERTPAVADVLVSTHTIASLPAAERIQGVCALADAVMPKGTLFLNLPSESDSDDLEQAMRQRFAKVLRLRYGNRLFMWIENFFAYRTGSKNPLALIFIGAASVACYLLSYLEEISLMRKGGAYTLYWCSLRQGDAVPTPVESLQELSLLSKEEMAALMQSSKEKS